ncbi:hypothetical protein ACFTQL_25165 [Peribacillus butanolivorans]|uniref:hypothetical protein n=1 Tax=Peribacillus butanolivorans TaxID=421767 RepID=UPI0036452C47
MEAILSQLIQLKQFNHGWTTLKKSFESNIIPHKGDFILVNVRLSHKENNNCNCSFDNEFTACFRSFSSLIFAIGFFLMCFDL